jgi:hypothetical protein
MSKLKLGPLAGRMKPNPAAGRSPNDADVQFARAMCLLPEWLRDVICMESSPVTAVLLPLAYDFTCGLALQPFDYDHRCT